MLRGRPHFPEAPQTSAGSHVFTEPGVYSVKLRVEDGCGGAGEAATVGEFDAMVVVYDPDQGFVTGGGRINSQPGAYPANPGALNTANPTAPLGGGQIVIHTH